MLYIWKLSNKFDLNQAIRVSHKKDQYTWLSNGSIRLGINYSVLNETKRNK